MPMRRHGVHRRLGAIRAAMAGTVLPVLPVAASPRPTGAPVRVVVAAAHGEVGAVTEAVRVAGGTVERTSDAVGELVAGVPASALSRLSGSGAVAGVASDVAMHLLGARYDAATDPGSMPNTAQAIGATAHRDAGYLGSGGSWSGDLWGASSWT